MFPYLIAGAIGFVVAKLLEEDEAPKYADGGDINYSNFRTSVIGLVNDNKVLILQRGSTANWMPNKWSIVGGVIDEGEVPIEAIIRECKEEIGLEPSNVYYDHKIMTNDSGEIYYFVGTLESTDVKLDYENSAYKFISKDAIDNYDFVPYIKEFILSIFLRNTNKLNNHFADGGSVLLAPNGKPSNLTPEQYKLVRTPEFKAWFGDWENDPVNSSKVVDENGEPLVVYHGTPYGGFYEFDLNNVGKNTIPYWGEGVYLTTSKSYAKGYAENKRTETQQIYNLFAKCLKPYIVKRHLIGRDSYMKMVEENQYNDFNDFLIDNNYDSVIILDGENIKDAIEIMTPLSNQIKLADGTNTTFDGENADIRYAGGGKVKKVKFDIEQDEDGDRTEISIKGIGQVILVVTYPEYEFLEDIGEDGLEELGIEEGDMIGKIEHIRIEDEYKGQGYAKLLMNKAIEVAKEKGLMPLYLNASPMGSDGLDVNDLTGFYESFGFNVFLEQGNNNLMILS